MYWQTNQLINVIQKVVNTFLQKMADSNSTIQNGIIDGGCVKPKIMPGQQTCSSCGGTGRRKKFGTNLGDDKGIIGMPRPTMVCPTCKGKGVIDFFPPIITMK